jgi:hypothetical protein
VVIALVTAVGCGGPGAVGATPQAGSDGGGHALEQDFTRVVKESLPSIVETTSHSGIGSG